MELTTEMIQKAMEGYVVHVDHRDLIASMNSAAKASGLLYGGILVFTAFVTWKICSIERKLKKMEEKEEA